MSDPKESAHSPDSRAAQVVVALREGLFLRSMNFGCLMALIFGGLVLVGGILSLLSLTGGLAVFGPVHVAKTRARDAERARAAQAAQEARGALRDACLAGEGEPSACRRLALELAGQEDAGAAEDLMLALCERRDAGACQTLGEWYAWSSPVLSPDEGKARRYRTRACDYGSGEACYQLVQAAPFSRHEYGLLERSCELDHAPACGDLADKHRTGRGASRDLKRAAELYEKACRGGATSACRRLADMYDQGVGVPEDESKAREYRRLGA